MYKTCARCGTIHDFNTMCYKNKIFKKKNTEADKFRRTYKWTQKAEQIKQRDHYLCKICLLKIYNTSFQYNFNKLETHHIVPLEEDYSKRLDDDNLITLCCYHHKLADNNTIPRSILYELIKEGCNLDELRKSITKNSPPLPNTNN